MNNLTEVESLAELQEIVANNERTVVEFVAPDWCVPCRRLMPHMEKVAEKSDAKFVSVDIDKAEDIRNTYQVMSVPTVLLFEKGEQKEIKGRTAIKILEEL